jgi:CDGSH-type Zn-finger protein
MAREVRHDANGPDVLDEDDLGDDGKIFVCRCGLSDTKPLCDGSHKATADEEEGVLYKYENDDDEEERHVIDELVFADE